MAIKGSQEGPSGEGTALYLDHTHVNMLVVMLYYSSARCYHWEQMGKGVTAQNFFVQFLTTVYESTTISNKKF